MNGVCGKLNFLPAKKVWWSRMGSQHHQLKLKCPEIIGEREFSGKLEAQIIIPSIKWAKNTKAKEMNSFV